jgi:hypothetical protein
MGPVFSPATVVSQSAESHERARKRSSRMLCDAALRAIFAKGLVRVMKTGRTTEALLYSALESIVMV